jgi:histidine ammonia-lyase
MEITGRDLTFQQVYKLGHNPYAQIKISQHTIDHLKYQRDLLEKAIKTGKPIYGVTTGFGSLSNVNIDKD